MGVCDTCGNRYRGSFEIRLGRATYTFDCFECAIERLAPRCSTCDVGVIGHGVEADGDIYCSAHCARAAGVRGLHHHAHLVMSPPES